jgi:hypothetical protein
MNGIAICTTSTGTNLPQIVTDGQDGFYASWIDHRDGLVHGLPYGCYYDRYNIYAQHCNSRSSSLWTDQGIPLCTETGYRQQITMTADGERGFFTAWLDCRIHANPLVYVQKVNKLGVPQWQDNGLAVSTTGIMQSHPKMCPDGLGGVIIAWNDRKDYDTTEQHYGRAFMQRIDANGNKLWDEEGNAIDNGPIYSPETDLIFDGDQGIYIKTYERQIEYFSLQGNMLWNKAVPAGISCWGVDSAGNLIYLTDTVYLHKIDKSGNDVILNHGLPVFSVNTASNYKSYRMAISPKGDTFIGRFEEYYSPSPQIVLIRLQKVLPEGTVAWDSSGVTSDIIKDVGDYLQIIPSQDGSVIVAWGSSLQGKYYFYNNYTRKFTKDGKISWTNTITNLTSDESCLKAISDAKGGVYLIWEDSRYRNTRKWVVAQHVSSSGFYLPPEQPGNLNAFINQQGEISLQWDDNSNTEEGFMIEYSSDGSEWKEIGYVPANITTFDVPHLETGHIFQFRVSSFIETELSTPSNTAIIKNPLGIDQFIWKELE